MSRFPEVSVPEFTRSLRAKLVRRVTQRDVRSGRGGGTVPRQGGGGEQQTLLTADGVRLSAVHVPGPDREWAFVVCHGFTGSWRGSDMVRIVSGFRSFGGVVAFDFRGHGTSRGRSTVGDLEVFDLHAAVEWARVHG
jgi:pimeloyl-ACP methyl ester carboxylesterase